MNSFRRLAAALSIAMGAPALAIVVPAGHADSLVATIASPGGNFYGDIATDPAGNLYVTGGSANHVYKSRPTGR